MCVVLIGGILDHYLHVALGTGKIIVASLKLGAIQIAFGSFWELCDKVLN